VITGIIVALPEEIGSLTHQKINKGECISLNNNTLLTLAGTGPENAGKASLLLIANGAERLISWGCAAALNDRLKPGDLIIPDQLLSEKNETLSISNPWSKYVQEQLAALNPHTDPLVESSHIVGESTDKKSIQEQSGGIALDMESIAIAKVALQHNYPPLVIRCIADPASMNLPKSITYAQNQQGEILLSKLLRYLLTHPSELPGLIKLGLHFKAAKNKLKLVAKQLDTIVSFDS
jgi:adenosylhomocysteine nucleosidase